MKWLLVFVYNAILRSAPTCKQTYVVLAQPLAHTLQPTRHTLEVSWSNETVIFCIHACTNICSDQPIGVVLS